MNSKLEALMSAYQIKPKANKRKIAKAPAKYPDRGREQAGKKNSIKSMKSFSIEKTRRKVVRESFSVLPKRSDSNLSLSRYLNASLDDDIERLDNITSKNSSARLDWISVKQQIIELAVSKKLIPIWESDEINDESHEKLSKISLDLQKKYDSKQRLDYKSRFKSSDNLLLA